MLILAWIIIGVTITGVLALIGWCIREAIRDKVVRQSVYIVLAILGTFGFLSALFWAGMYLDQYYK